MAPILLGSLGHVRERWHMNDGTEYNRKRFVARYEAFQRAHPDRPVEDTVQGFLRSLPISQQASAKTALKQALGRRALEWEDIRVARYHRDEIALEAGILREPQRQRLRETVTDPRDRALLESHWTLRRFEVAALRWADLDLERGYVRVRRGKGGKPAWTRLPDKTREALRAWYDAAGRPAPDAWVFPIPRGVGHPRFIGQPYSPNGLGKRVQRLLAKAGLWQPGAGCAHRFRRTFATVYLTEHEKDLPGLQALMRHENIATTAKYIFFATDDLGAKLARVNL